VLIYGSAYRSGFPVSAMLWLGGASQFVNLQPEGYGNTEAVGGYADDVGDRQVGIGYKGNEKHALLWAGSAAGVVDLHPPHLVWSEGAAG
jgi:hypothetical protein